MPASTRLMTYPECPQRNGLMNAGMWQIVNDHRNGNGRPMQAKIYNAPPPGPLQQSRPLTRGGVRDPRGLMSPNDMCPTPAGGRGLWASTCTVLLGACWRVLGPLLLCWGVNVQVTVPRLPPKNVSGGCDYAKGGRLSTCFRHKRLPEYEGITTRPNSR